MKNLRLKKYNLGYGIIELLIAVALSSVVSIAVVQLFIQNKSSHLAHEDITRTQENGRYAINLLTNAIKSADFWGCVPSFTADTQSEVISWPENDVEVIVDGLPMGFVGVTGIEGASSTGLAGFPAQPDQLIISGIQRGRSFPILESIDPYHTDDIIISLNNSTQSDISANEILVMSDCAKAIIFQVTNDVDTTVVLGGTDQPNSATIEHSTTPAITTPPSLFNNRIAGINNGPYSARTTTVFKGVNTNVTFFINPSVDHDGLAATPPIPSLMRSTGSDPVPGGVPIVPGVETLQVMYGEDTNVPYDFQADRYVNAANVVDWESVVSVRISILVRSPEANSEGTPGYTLDGVTVNNTSIPADANGKFHTRKVYSTTISIRNRMS